MRRYILAGTLALSTLALVLWVNALMVDVQWEEMELLLSRSTTAESGLESVTLWGRLELVKNRLRRGEAPVENYVLEARIQALTRNLTSAPEPRPVTWKTTVALTLRGLLGRSSLLNPEQDSVLDQVEQAYLQERSRDFTQAALSYKKIALENPGMTDELMVRILLHQGFCLAFSGDKPQALGVFQYVLEKYPDTEGASLARLVVDFIRSLEEKSILAAGARGEDRVRESYLAMDYRKALKHFDENALQDSPEARYFKGRSHEELGDIEASQAEYRRVLFLDPQGPWGRESRRRLVMQDIIYEQKSELTSQAVQEIAKGGDPEFAQSLRSYPGVSKTAADPFLSPSIPTGELFIDTRPQGAQILLNGVQVGISPFFLTEVPIGKVDILARKEGRTAVLTVQIQDRSIRKVLLDLPPGPQEPPLGRIILNTPHTLVDAYLGDNLIKDLTKIPAGKHLLTLSLRKSNGELLVWDREITLGPGGVVTLDIP